jgi:hypothetical protein
MITFDPELVNVIRNTKHDLLRIRAHQFHRRKPSLERVGADLWFEGSGEFLPKRFASLVHTDLLTAPTGTHTASGRGQSETLHPNAFPRDRPSGVRKVRLDSVKIQFYRGKMENIELRAPPRGERAGTGGAERENSVKNVGKPGVTKLLQFIHRLFTAPCPLLPASGRRLETAEKTDKKKSEFYFLIEEKKILTAKSTSARRDFFTSDPRTGSRAGFARCSCFRNVSR